MPIPVGTYVGFDFGMGVVVSQKEHWRYGDHKEQILHRIRYVDVMLDKTPCPDDRCKGENEGCPICGRSLWIEQMRPISEEECMLLMEFAEEFNNREEAKS